MIQLPTKNLDLLLNKGLPEELVQLRFSYELSTALLSTSEFIYSDDGKAYCQNPRQQLEKLNQIVEKPLANQVTVISNNYTDLVPKQVAAWLMSQVFERHRLVNSAKTSPTWYVANSLSPLTFDNPVALFVSNVYSDSTSYRLEQVRDLLNRNSSIPRYVITAGVDPLEFAVKFLKIKPFLALNIKTNFEFEKQI